MSGIRTSKSGLVFDIFNILLQVLDDGRLTDGQGHVVDFRNTLIVLTSNIGSDLIAAEGAQDLSAAVRGAVMDQVKQHFRPELINRLDEILLFRRLSRKDMDQIVAIQLRALEKLLRAHNITLELSEAARKWLADEGYDPVYGARPLRRILQRSLQNKLAEAFLSGVIKDGDVVRVDKGDGGLRVL